MNSPVPAEEVRRMIAVERADIVALQKALEVEKADHRATMRRWLKIAESQARAIARARKALRDDEDKGLAIFAAYKALDWRNRR